MPSPIIISLVLPLLNIPNPNLSLLGQVWAGTEACEPVTWQECKLVPKDVNFIVPEITCKDKQEIW